jgi:hypothetical protein
MYLFSLQRYCLFIHFFIPFVFIFYLGFFFSYFAERWHSCQPRPRVGLAGWPVGGVGRSALLAPFLYSRPRTAALSYDFSVPDHASVCEIFRVQPAENQYFISGVAAGCLPSPEPERAGRMPPTFPPPNLSDVARSR